MYSYHGWLSTYKSFNIDLLRGEIKELNHIYPASCDAVNGQYHIAFSGNPNRDTGVLGSIVELLISKKIGLTGCIYVNDANNFENRYIFQVIKIVKDEITYMNDRNFSNDETEGLFR